MDTLVQGISGDQQIFIGGDLSGLVGKDSDCFGRVYEDVVMLLV